MIPQEVQCNGNMSTRIVSVVVEADLLRLGEGNVLSNSPGKAAPALPSTVDRDHVELISSIPALP